MAERRPHPPSLSVAILQILILYHMLQRAAALATSRISSPYTKRGLVRVVAFSVSNPNEEQVQDMLSNVLSRATRTLSSKSYTNFSVNSTCSSEPWRNESRVDDDSVLDMLEAIRVGTANGNSSMVRTDATRSTNSAVSSSFSPSVTSAIRLDSLFTNSISRAKRTFTTKVEFQEASKSNKLVDDTVTTILDKVQQQGRVPSPTPAPDPLPRPTDTDLHYQQNPALSATALAHSLWGYVLRPGLDSAIDATAGNGGDAATIATMLFSNVTQSSTSLMPTSRSELVCVDVQTQACANTRSALEDCVGSDVVEQRVRIIQASHAPLPLPTDTSSIALVVFNLGFLPQSENKARQTQTDTTLAAMADACTVLRIGGLLSVMTYPASNAHEDALARAFMESLALYSSKTENWETFVDELMFPAENDDTATADAEDWNEQLRRSLRYVYEENGPTQTWRVHEHRKIGWKNAPVLLTAIRIK
jgi:hypothetical protein